MPEIAEQISIVLNGGAFAVSAPATIASLIALRKPRPPFAVELNQKLVTRDEYNATRLGEGDRVEVVTLVGGG